MRYGRCSQPYYVVPYYVALLRRSLTTSASSSDFGGRRPICCKFGRGGTGEVARTDADGGEDAVGKGQTGRRAGHRGRGDGMSGGRGAGRSDLPADTGGRDQTRIAHAHPHAHTYFQSPQLHRGRRSATPAPQPVAVLKGLGVSGRVACLCVVVSLGYTITGYLW